MLEFIWVLCFDAPAVEFISRKVFEIEGDDGIVVLYCGCENVAIIGIGQLQDIDELLIIGN